MRYHALGTTLCGDPEARYQETVLKPLGVLKSMGISTDLLDAVAIAVREAQAAGFYEADLAVWLFVISQTGEAGASYTRNELSFPGSMGEHLLLVLRDMFPMLLAIRECPPSVTGMGAYTLPSLITDSLTYAFMQNQMACAALVAARRDE